jgi:alpha-D-ribose 1-methylphosphonate 5-triphosphate synthase subunit PhnL
MIAMTKPEHLLPRLALSGVSKTFTLHLKGGTVLPVVRNVTFDVHDGECVVLGGQSGAGKSSILKMIYASYRADSGSILVRDGTQDGTQTIDIATASPRRILALRQTTLGYVSQFLRAIPRVSALDLVIEALREGSSAAPPGETVEAARALLLRLNLPERLHGLPPATFSGGEQARVNIARGFAARRPILLLDEPTASLDADNRSVVEQLIAERRREGAAIVGIFHDDETRSRVATRSIDVARFAANPLAPPLLPAGSAHHAEGPHAG